MPKPPTIRTKIRAPIQVDVAIMLPSDFPCYNQACRERSGRHNQAQSELVVKNPNGKRGNTHLFQLVRYTFQHIHLNYTVPLIAPAVHFGGGARLPFPQIPRLETVATTGENDMIEAQGLTGATDAAATSRNAARQQILKGMEGKDTEFYQNTFRPLLLQAKEAHTRGDMRAFGQAVGELSRVAPMPYKYQMGQDGNFDETFRSNKHRGYTPTGSKITPQAIRAWSANKNAKKPYRDVPIRPSLLNEMEDWLREDQERGRGDYIITYKGQPINSMKHGWHDALKRAGITRRIRPYDLRHAFATLALDAGADLKAVSDVMGHADPTMVLKHYQHTTEALRRYGGSREIRTGDHRDRIGRIRDECKTDADWRETARPHRAAGKSLERRGKKQANFHATIE